MSSIVLQLFYLHQFTAFISENGISALWSSRFLERCVRLDICEGVRSLTLLDERILPTNLIYSPKSYGMTISGIFISYETFVSRRDTHFLSLLFYSIHINYTHTTLCTPYIRAKRLLIPLGRVFTVDCTMGDRTESSAPAVDAPMPPLVVFS